MRNIIDYIRRPDYMDAQAVEHLKELTEKYPYFHSARVLLLQGLYKQHSPAFDQELKRNAVLLPSRKTLFHFAEEHNYSVRENRKRYDSSYTESDREDRTEHLISNFLSTVPQETTPRVRSVDATQDYMAYLLQTEQGEDTVDMPLNGGGVIEDYLEQEPDRPRLNPNSDAPLQTPVINDNNDGGGEIFTEIMASIYIKQGKYENAVKIIQQLSLKYPKKNRYFADQLRFLNKLIINNKNKK